jgi:hypothetical protein
VYNKGPPTYTNEGKYGKGKRGKSIYFSSTCWRKSELSRLVYKRNEGHYSLCGTPRSDLAT